MMAEKITEVTEIIDTSFNFPYINIYKRYYDGVHSAWRAYPQEGYVMYDTSDSPQMDYNPETGEYFEVTHYYTMAGFPLNFNFDNFSWVAVLRSEVDEHCKEAEEHGIIVD